MKDQHRNLANAIAPHIEVNGASLVLPQSGYDAVLPETVSAEVAETLNKHHKDLVPSVTIAFGEKAIDVLKANPSFPQVEGVAQFGATKITTITERSGMRTVGIPKEGQPAEKVATPGFTTVKVATNAGKALKDAREHVANLGAGQL